MDDEDALLSVASSVATTMSNHPAAVAADLEEPRGFAPEPHRFVRHRGTSPDFVPPSVAVSDAMVQVGRASYRIEEEERAADELRRRCDRLQRLWDRAQGAFKKSLECMQDENWKLREQFREPSV